MEAQEESQRYKVGKFILETKRIKESVDWENGEGYGDVFEYSGIREESPRNEIASGRKGDAIEFDSQDEDECEDLFAGVWSPELALKRRRGRRFGKSGDGCGSGSGSARRARSEDVR